MKLSSHGKVLTATVGSYPKPRYIYPRKGRSLLDSFGFAFDCRRRELGPAEFSRLLDKAALEAIKDQEPISMWAVPKYATLTHHSIQQGALEAVVIMPKAGLVRLYSVHLSHLASATRLPQVEALLDIHARAVEEGGAWCGGHPDPKADWTEGEMPPMPADAILMGDFNFDWTYDRIVGPLSPQHARLNRSTGFVDAWVAAGHHEEEGRPSPKDDASIIAFLAHARMRVPSCWIDSEAEGSDHQPLWVEIDL